MAFLPNIRQLLFQNKSAGKPTDSVTFKDYGSDMRFAEIWARQPIQQLVAGSNITLSPSSGLATDSKGNGPNPVTISATGGGGTFYASLTGTGETNPVGTLTQTGPFNITDTTNPSTGIALSTAHGNVTVAATAGNVTVSSAATSGLVVLQVSGASGTAALNATGGGSCEMLVHNGAHVTVNGNGLVDIVSENSQNVQLGADNLVTTKGRNGTQIEPLGGLVGFYGTTPIAVQFVTGSRGGNAALANLLTALADFGLIVDSTTP